jgi:hypothetical protein
MVEAVSRCFEADDPADLMQYNNHQPVDNSADFLGTAGCWQGM